MTGAGSDSTARHHRRARRHARRHRRPQRRGGATRHDVGARLVDRRRRPVAGPGARGRGAPAAGRRHAGGADRRCGCPAATRCSACTACPRATSARSRWSRSQRVAGAVRRGARGARRRARSISTARPSAPTVAPRSARRARRRGGRRASTAPPRRRSRAATASDGPFAHRQDRGARLVGAFLFPVAHRTTLRAVVSLGTQGHRRRRAGCAARRRRGGARVAGRSSTVGMRVELPDEPLQRAVETARVATVLAGQAWRVDPEVAAVLEDWGLDAEAAVAWGRLTGRARRRLRKRAIRAGSRGRRCSQRAAEPDARAARRAARRCSCATHDAGVALLDDWPARVGRSADRRARRTDAPRAGVVLGALARRPSGAAVGRPARARRSPRPGSTPRGRRPTRAARRSSRRSAALTVTRARSRRSDAGEPEREQLPRSERRPTGERCELRAGEVDDVTRRRGAPSRRDRRRVASDGVRFTTRTTSAPVSSRSERRHLGARRRRARRPRAGARRARPPAAAHPLQRHEHVVGDAGQRRRRTRRRGGARPRSRARAGVCSCGPSSGRAGRPGWAAATGSDRDR